MTKKDLLQNPVIYYTFIILLVAIAVALAILIRTYVGYVVIESEAGTITKLIITQEYDTYRWYGFYGLALSVRGYEEIQWDNTYPGGIKSLHLIFDCLEPDIQHEVYAMIEHPETLNWDTIQPGNTVWADNFYNISPFADDSITKTFTETGSIMFGNTNITNIPFTYTKKYGEPGSREFDLGLLNVDGIPVFVTNKAAIQFGFNNQRVNYQLMLPSPVDLIYYFYSDPNDVCPEAMGLGTLSYGNIHGYVTDNTTNEFLNDVTIGISDNETKTNIGGFYNITTLSGTRYIVAIKQGYYIHAEQVNIVMASSLQKNISLNPVVPAAYNGTIKGNVYDSVTNEKIANASIYISNAIFVSNNTGFYNGSVYEGNFTVVAMKQGYNLHIGRTSIVRNEETTYDIYLTPDKGAIEGYTIDNSTGQLLEGVRVSILNHTKITGPDANFSFTVKTGEHFLVATKLGYENYVENVTIKPGEKIKHNITMIPLAPFRLYENGTIIGTVKDNITGEKIQNAYISVAGVIDITQADGLYNITVIEGTHNIVAFKPGYDNYIGQVNVTPLGITVHNITMNPYEKKYANGTIEGYVRNWQGNILSDVNISVAGGVTTSNTSGRYIMSVVEGKHNLVAVREGYDNYISQVVINPENTTFHNITMNATVVPLYGTGPGEVRRVEIQRPQPIYPRREGEIDYDISTRTIVRRLRVGSFVNIPILINNYRAHGLNVEITTTGNVSQLIRIEKQNFSINPRSSDDFTITLIGNAEVGIYEGQIIIGGDIEEVIDVTVLLYSREKLPIEGLLIDLQLMRTRVDVGETLDYKVDLQNLFQEEEYPVTLIHKIFDTEGNEFVIYKDDLRIQTSFSILKSFTIPETFKNGKHVLTIEAHYVDQVSRQSSTFIVGVPFYMYSILGAPVWAILAGLFSIGAMIFLGGIYKKKKEKKQRYKTKVKTKSLPQPGERSAYVGKIAETDIKTYLDLDKFQVHTLIAGASGSGKSVVAQDLVEESLMKNVAVIVFDPTSQWTGFLRKNEDKKILDLYPKFDMKKKDAKAFNGNIHTVSDGREIIEFKKYMVPGAISVFLTNKLDIKNTELFVANTIKQVFNANLPESTELKYLLVYDGVHTLLPKFGGSGKVFVQIERAAREFRKWGVGLVLISQVISDFPKEVLANINTQMQLRTRDEGDLEKVKEEYGEDLLKSIVKAATGTTMIENSAYNEGQPYFISFRPPMHSLKRLSEEELKDYEKYNNVIDDIEYQIEQLKGLEIDTFDLELELKLAKDKINSGAFNMVSIYLDGLTPRLKEQWEKIGKTPKKKEIKLMSEEEIKKDLEKAKEENLDNSHDSNKESETKDKEYKNTKKQENEESKKDEVIEKSNDGEKKEQDKNVEKNNDNNENNSENNLSEINLMVKKTDELIRQGKKQEAMEIYKKINSLYSSLPQEEKKDIFNKCKELYDKLRGVN